MIRTDERGCRLSGANAAAAELYEHALIAACSWRNGADALALAAQREAPDFVMAHLLPAWLLVCSRDPRRVQSARAIVARAMRLPANDGERAHMAALCAVLGDHYELAKALLGEQLTREPRDLLALQFAHALDHVTGDTPRMLERVERLLRPGPAICRAATR